MGNLPNPKILGATLVGLALVGGAYVTTNFGEPDPRFQTASTPATAEPLKRVAIEVEDRDNNGIEDWRDTFVTNEPIVLDRVNPDYTPPDTVTGKASISLLTGLLESKIYAPIAPRNEEVIKNTVNTVRDSLKTRFYRSTDISIITEWGPSDVVNYGNAVASTIYLHNLPESDYELNILDDIVRGGETERVEELTNVANVYKNYVDDTLLIPVPDILVKEHLDLINGYQALYEDIKGMSVSLDDPITGLAHTKRYTSSTEGLRLALVNLLYGLEPYARDFAVDDPALLLVLFSPDYQPQI